MKSINNNSDENRVRASENLGSSSHRLSVFMTHLVHAVPACVIQFMEHWGAVLMHHESHFLEKRIMAIARCT